MKVVQYAAELRGIVNNSKNEGKIVGFVPTMGALHPGHISLIEKARESCDYIICSIFVNPTQFNDKRDLEKYPRTFENDCKMLEKAGCDLVFHPSVEEIYPQPDTRVFDFGSLDKVMEGAHRPGHFNGVAQVVSRLFDMVSPHKAFFGLKDFQQLAIIRAMVKQLNYPIEIVPVPTMREPDGLAMSSRNTRLSPAERRAAPAVSKALFAVKQQAATASVAALKRLVKDVLQKEPLIGLEYFELADAITLEPVPAVTAGRTIACIAVKLGEVRLIDNVLL